MRKNDSIFSEPNNLKRKEALIVLIENLFLMPRRRLKRLLPWIISLSKSLDSHLKSSELVSIISFLNLISEAGDNLAELEKTIDLLKKASSKRYSGEIDALNMIRDVIKDCGKKPYKFNYAKKGEKITADKVFLGDISGMTLKPVSKWIKDRNAPKGILGFPLLKDLNYYDLVFYQAQDIMKSNADALREALHDLSDLGY